MLGVSRICDLRLLIPFHAENDGVRIHEIPMAVS